MEGEVQLCGEKSGRRCGLAGMVVDLMGAACRGTPG